MMSLVINDITTFGQVAVVTKLSLPVQRQIPKPSNMAEQVSAVWKNVPETTPEPLKTSI